MKRILSVSVLCIILGFAEGIHALAQPDSRIGQVKFLPAEEIYVYDRRDEPAPIDLGRYENVDTHRKEYFWGDEDYGGIGFERNRDESQMMVRIRLNSGNYKILFQAANLNPDRKILLGTVTGYTLRKGWIYSLPYGELYRPEEFVGVANGRSYTVLKHLSYKDAGLEGEPDYTRYYVPIASEGNTGNGALGEFSIRFHYAIETLPGRKEPSTVLKCSMGTSWHSFKKQFGEENPIPTGYTFNVQEGSVLPMLDVGFRVLKIVPPSEEKKMMGWVELDLQPILLRSPMGKLLEKHIADAQSIPPEVRPTPAK